MLDVEYLLKPTLLERTMIYRYRSGVLGPKVKRVYSEFAEREGIIFNPCEPRELLETLLCGSLIEPVHVCEWSRAQATLSRTKLSELLDLLASGVATRTAVFVHANASVTKHERWAQVESASFVIEEPMVTPETLRAVLRYLVATTDLAHNSNLLQEETFVASFDALLDRNGTDLPDLMDAFDQTILTRTDPKTHMFDHCRHQVDVLRRRGRTAPAHLLRRFVASGDECDLVRLVIAFEDRHRDGLTAHAVLAELYRITEGLLRSTGGPNKSVGRPIPPPAIRAGPENGCILWAATVLAWEDRLAQSSLEARYSYRRGPNLLISTLNQLGRDYVTRAGRSNHEDCLADLWSGLRQSFTKFARGDADRLTGPRKKVVVGLGELLAKSPDRAGPAWLPRLRAYVTAAISEIEHVLADQSS